MNFMPSGILNFNSLANAGQQTKNEWDNAIGSMTGNAALAAQAINAYNAQQEILNQRNKRKEAAAKWGNEPWAKGDAFDAARQQYIMDGNASGIAQLQRDWQNQENIKAMNAANAARESNAAKDADKAAKAASETETRNALNNARQEVANFKSAKTATDSTLTDFAALETKAQIAIEEAARLGANEDELTALKYDLQKAKDVIATTEQTTAAKKAENKEAYESGLKQAKNLFKDASKFQKAYYKKNGIKIGNITYSVGEDSVGKITIK